MPGFVLSADADTDIDDIWDFIAQNDPEQAARFLLKLLDLFVLIASNPLMGTEKPQIHADMRQFPYGSYSIFYRPDQNGVEIMRVLHSARDIPQLFENDLPN